MKLASWLSLCVLWMAVPARAGDMEEAARGYNGLGFQLLAQCRQSLPNTNYFLSPSGLAFALAMAGNGAQGETLRQIMGTLGTGAMPLDQLNEANKELLDHLAKLDPKIKLEIANSIWIDRKATIKPGFISVNRRDYDAEGNQQLGQRQDARKNPGHPPAAAGPDAPVNPAGRDLFQGRLGGAI